MQARAGLAMSGSSAFRKRLEIENEHGPLKPMAGLGTDDRRSAQPLAPREQLRYTYFLLWGWSAQKSPDKPVVPQGEFRVK
jgi:hypothetical protein